VKVLMYAPVFPPAIGGPSTQCFSLCQALVARGERPIVVTSGERFERASPHGFPVYRYPWRYTGTPLDRAIRWLIFPWYFSRILRRERPDVVHCHSVSVLAFVAGRLARRDGIPAVLKFAGDWVWETLSRNELRARDFADLRQRSAVARLLWRFEGWGLSLFDCIWVPSEFRARNVETVLGHRRTVRIIANALDLPPGGHREAKEGDPFVVVSAGRFVPHKRIPMLVRAFAALGDPAATLVLIGTGADAEVARARAAASAAGVGSQVVFTGRLEIEGVYEHLKRASVYVSASLEEGFPNVFVEAMHFGVPVISTDVGGCREIVREGETGYLYDPMDEALLVERLKRLRHDRGLRNRMARSAHAHSSRYRLATAIEEFMGLYRDCSRTSPRTS
jgi:glycosyltransferase involved in cell wall biosynthesis